MERSWGSASDRTAAGEVGREGESWEIPSEGVSWGNLRWDFGGFLGWREE